jgi:hypothetical protein
VSHLRAVFSQLQAKIRYHFKKMILAVPSVEYLGHFVVPNGTSIPQQVKVEDIAKKAPPTNVFGLRAFLGTPPAHYRRYVKNCRLSHCRPADCRNAHVAKQRSMGVKT